MSAHNLQAPNPLKPPNPQERGLNHVDPAERDLSQVDEQALLQELTTLVDDDRRTTAAMLACIAEVDRRKLYAAHAFPSMFAFCVERFRMSEAVAAKRIRAGRAACRFPCIFGMIERGELHLSGVHQLARHLTEDNHQEVLQRAKHRSMRAIDGLIAEIAPQPDVPNKILTLPSRPAAPPTNNRLTATNLGERTSSHSTLTPGAQASVVPLSPRRYKVQVTVGEETHDKLRLLQDLLSHQIPDGDPAEILDRALDALLEQVQKRKAALTDRPRHQRENAKKPRTRVIPAGVRREVWKHDRGRCQFADAHGNRCHATRQIEFHHMQAFAKGGGHDPTNIELRCRTHNQHEADRAYGKRFMDAKRGYPPRQQRDP